MHLYGVFASQWPQGRQTVWTIVNRNQYNVTGRQMSVPYAEGMRYFDLYNGVELTAERAADEAVLSFPIEAHGYAAVLATPGAPAAPMSRLMGKMKAMTARPLAEYSNEWEPLPQQMVPIEKSKPGTIPLDRMAW